MSGKYINCDSKEEAITIMMEHVNKMKKAEFNVLRYKLETTANCSIVPKTSEEVDKNLYFEFHFKCIIKDKNEYEKLKILCKNNNAHLSKNSYKKYEDYEKRFVTIRVYDIQKKALDKYLYTEDLIKKIGIKIDGACREYTVFDSNIELDNGWM